MNITREPFDDRSVPNANGMCEFMYVGTYYAFCDRGDKLAFRLYRDEPGIAHLLHPVYWKPQLDTTELFRQSKEYLRSNEGVKEIQVFSPLNFRGGPLSMEKAIELALTAGLG